MTIDYLQLTPNHFDAIIALGNFVHGDNYLDADSMQQLYEKSHSGGVNASWVAVLNCKHQLANTQHASRFCDDGYLIGFRLTIAAEHWQADQWCTPQAWSVPTARVCYFKCNTVDAEVRGQGVGKMLLSKSIDSVKQQGAAAGLAHIWMASPNNSAFGYFSACGGELIAKHPNKWQHLCIEDNYQCPVCEGLCECTAAEMLLRF